MCATAATRPGSTDGLSTAKLSDSGLAIGTSSSAEANGAAACSDTKAAFEAALDYLNAAPLSTREIRESLDEAGRSWAAMTQALKQVRRADGQVALGEASEALLAVFEQLTQRYEHSMQILMG